MAPLALLVAVLVVVWALTGAGYFWPIWNALGYALLSAVSWIFRHPLLGRRLTRHWIVV